MKKLAVFLILLSFYSCGEPPPQPNEPFYCKIDGKRFRPDNGGDIFFEALLAQRDENNNIFDITVYSEERGWVGLFLKFKNIHTEFKEKNYVMNDEFKGHYSTPNKTVNGVSSSTTYESYLQSGFITFSKIDTVKQRVSGTFEFKAKDKKSEKTISITKGQFNDVFFY